MFGYPILVMDFARRMHTSVSFANEHAAPTNQFAHNRLLASAREKAGVRPHADSLGSVAWLDLSKEPIVLSVPTINRHFVLPIWTAWYDLVAVISSRTVGIGNRHFAIVGPRWHGRLPDPLERIAVPTERVWINGRLQAAGVEDIETVHHLQDQLRLTHLSDWGRSASPHPVPFVVNVDTNTTPHEQVARLDGAKFYTRLSQLIRKTAPRVCDAPMLEQLTQLGMFAGSDLAIESLPARSIQVMQDAVPAAQSRIAAAEKQSVLRWSNNWSLHTHPGQYGTNYLQRAADVRLGLASTLADDVVCLYTNVDVAGNPLRGLNQYVIQFDREHSPPVHAFWTITLYNSKHLPAANVIRRHFIGNLDKLRINHDGSFSIYVQHEWPGIPKDCNWLPAPCDAFELVFQLYWPKPEVLQGSWRPPAVMRLATERT